MSRRSLRPGIGPSTITARVPAGPALMRSLAVFASLALVCLASGCGPSVRSPFSYRSPDNRRGELRGVLTRLQAAPDVPAEESATSRIVAMTTAEPTELLAFEMEPEGSATLRWRRPIQAATKPEIRGDIVVTSDPDQVIALDASSGETLWSRPMEGLAYIGSTRTAELLIYAASVGAFGGARRESSLVAVLPRSGDVVWRHDVSGVVGAPEHAGSMIFVPWERHSLSVLDATGGAELTRIRSTDDVIAWTWASGKQVFYGYREPILLTEDAASGASDDSPKLSLAFPELGLRAIGRVRTAVSLRDDSFVPRPNARSSRDRIRWIAAPERENDSITLVGDSFYLVYYRYVFGFDLQGRIQWARTFEHAVGGATATERGVVIVDESGTVSLLDSAHGQTAWSTALCESQCELASLAFDLGAIAGGPVESGPSLREQLLDVARDPDNRLLPARAFAVRALSALPEPEISRELLALYRRAETAGALRQAIVSALRTREQGLLFLLDSLHEPYDFLEDREAPPIAAIVPALVEQESVEAIPMLIARLFDPATGANELPILIEGLGELARPADADRRAQVRDALLRFLRLYRADRAFAEDASPLASAARALFGIEGEESSALAALAAEPDTIEALRGAISELYESAARARAEEAERLAERERLEREAAARHAEAARPLTLSQPIVDAALGEHDDAFRSCAEAELQRDAELVQLRIAFVLTRAGDTSEVVAVPPSTTSCVDEALDDVVFPRFRAPRMQAQYVLQLREAIASDDEPIPEDVPWWYWWAQQARESSPTRPERRWWQAESAPQAAAPTGGASDRPSREFPTPPANSDGAPDRPTDAPPTQPAVAPAPTSPTEEDTSPAPPPTRPWWAPASQ